MEAFEQRVLDEKVNLDAKIDRLAEFIGEGILFETLSMDEQARLDAQLHVMRAYVAILSARLRGFQKQDEVES